MKISENRRDYRRCHLNEDTLSANPVEQFRTWFEEAMESGIPDPTAMIVSTCSGNNRPSSRTVLLKDFSSEGFSFYTNYSSRKAKELEENPNLALLFFWPVLERQIRIEGKVKKMIPDVSDAYFAQRPRQSQIATWASEQSSIIPDRQFLESRFREAELEFKSRTIPRPEYWGGYLVVPDYFEFWQGRESRLHDRIVYEKRAGNWQNKRLAP